MKQSSLYLAMTLVLPTFALAQTVGSPQTIELEPITVQARFVSESSYDLPFTANSISDVTLEKSSNHSLETLMQQTAGVEVHSFGNPQSTVKIRGVGMLSNESGSSDDTSVVIYQNGAPQTNNRLSQPLFDMQQVDVLKGPQGTLYGRNSAAGVINLVPNKPSDRPGSSIDIKVGSHHHQEGTVVLNQPINEDASIRIAAHGQKQDHALDNIQNGGKELARPNNRAIRLSMSQRISEHDEMLLTTEHSNQRQQFAGFTILDGKAITDIDASKLKGEHKNSSATLNWTHDADNVQFSSTTNILRDKYLTGGPSFDNRIYHALFNKSFKSNREIGNKQQQFFQEFRIGSAVDAPFFWTTGVNYLRSKRDFHFEFLENEEIDAAGNPMNARIDRNYKNQSAGIFGEMTYPIVKDLALTAGVRYNRDEVDYKGRWKAKKGYQMNGPREQSNASSLTDKYLTGRIGLTYDLTNSVKLYGIFAHGHKTGGFGEFSTSIASGLPDEPYRAANTNSYEIGTKFRNEDNSLEASVALFHNKTRDEHLYVLTNPSVNWANVTENFDTKSQGAEASLSWQPNEAFKLGANVAYTDARITKVPEKTLSTAKKNNRVPDVPRWSAGISADYYQPVTVFDNATIFNAHIDYSLTGKRSEDVSNNFTLKAAHIVNARLGISDANSEIYLWGNNLLDDRSPIFGYQFDPVPKSYGGTEQAVRSGSVRQGRTIGLGYNYQF